MPHAFSNDSPICALQPDNSASARDHRRPSTMSQRAYHGVDRRGSRSGFTVTSLVIVGTWALVGRVQTGLRHEPAALRSPEAAGEVPRWPRGG